MMVQNMEMLFLREMACRLNNAVWINAGTNAVWTNAWNNIWTKACQLSIGSVKSEYKKQTHIVSKAEFWLDFDKTSDFRN